MLLLAAAAYLGLRPLLGEESPALPTPEPTATVEPVTVEVDGVVIRQESVLRGEGEYMLPLLADGEQAAAGEAIALVSDEPAAIETAQTRLRLSSELADAVSGVEPEPDGALAALSAARASGDCAGLLTAPRSWATRSSARLASCVRHGCSRSWPPCRKAAERRSFAPPRRGWSRPKPTGWNALRPSCWRT